MKRKQRINWTAAPSKLQEDITKRKELWSLPTFHPEPKLEPEALAAWNEIVPGSAVQFVEHCTVQLLAGHPYGVLYRIHKSGLPIAHRAEFSVATFALYIGTTNVKMKLGNRELKTIERSFRALLVGQNKYLLDDPNVVRPM